MSGVAGGNRILRQDVQGTFNKYVDEVLRKIPGFKKASLSGSVKAGSKADFGDLDIITWFPSHDNGGKAQLKFWGREFTRFLLTLNATVFEDRSQTARDKLRSREGNSPDHQLRSQSIC